ncbi:MAG: AAA-like domain-containing protein, partial [Chloroflexales bacterium]
MITFSSTALPSASPLFRGRQAELARLKQICQDDVTAYRVIYGGHQNGKTSLLLQLEADLRVSVHVCTINFQRIPGATPSQVYAHIGQGIANVLPMGVSAAQIVDAPDLTAFLTQVLQRREIRRLVLLLDELGALPTATRAALGSALRALFQDRLNIPALAKLQIIFSGGIELYNLVVTEASSLHNVCEATYLEDLTRDEAVGLIADGLLAAGADHALAIGEMVYERVNGHPYLTQRIGGLLVEYTRRGEAIGPEQVAHVEREIGQYGDPLLRQIQNDMHEHQLESAVRLLLTTPPRFTRLDDAMTRLELIGLAKRDGERWAPRNPLLADVFREVLDVPVPMPEPTSAIPQAHGESDSAPPVSDVQSVVTAKKRRLAALELQAARYGIDCPPHISVEIDELRQEIAQFAPRTATVRPVRPVAPAATPVTPTVTQPPPTSVASVTPSSPAPAPAPAAVGMWAKRYGWVVIPFLVIIAVIAIPQMRSTLTGGIRQSTVVSPNSTIV